MNNHANRPEILAARSHELGTTARFSDTLDTMMMYLALPVWSEDIGSSDMFGHLFLSPLLRNG